MFLDLWPSVAPLLDEALALDGAERATFVDSVRDGGVRDELRRYLGHAPSDEDATVGGLFGRRTPEVFPSGTVVGQYRLDAHVGSGGSGAVYRAVDLQAGKTVAVKVIAASGPGGRADRIEHEVRVLARLQHPGIATYFNTGRASVPSQGGGTLDVLWIAMEFVNGEPVTSFAAREELDGPTRVRLVVQACEALQYALGRRVLHGDVKPSNLMAGRDHSGRPVVKVIDFGVGVILDEEHAGRVSGLTPAYAAPEVRGGHPATAEADVWSLGTVARELLGGQGANFGAVLAKATADIPEARYEDAGAFRDDLERSLGGHPVVARERTALYVGARLVRRHRGRFAVGAAALAVAVLLVVGLVRSRAEAQRQAAAASEATALFASLFDAANPFNEVVGGLDTLRTGEFVRLSALRIDRDPPADPEVRARIDCALAAVQTAVGQLDDAESRFDRCFDAVEEAGVGRPTWVAAALRERASLRIRQGDYVAAEEDARLALAADVEATGSLSEAVAGDLARLAEALQYQTRLDSAEAVRRRALSVFRSVDGGDGLLTATGQNDLASTLILRGRYDEAIALVDSSLLIRRRRLGLGHARTAVTLNDLGTIHSEAGRYETAEGLLQEALSVYERVWGPDHPMTVGPMKNLAVVYGRSGDTGRALPLNERALEVRRRALGPDHPLTIQEMNNVAWVYRNAGRVGESVQMFEDGYRRSLGVLGDSAWVTLMTAGNLADTYRVAGDPERATELHARTIGVVDAAIGPDHPMAGIGRVMWASALVDSGRPREAIVVSRRAVEILDSALDPGHRQRILARLTLGDALLATSDSEGAARVLALADREASDHYDEGDPLLERAQNALSRARGVR